MHAHEDVGGRIGLYPQHAADYVHVVRESDRIQPLVGYHASWHLACKPLENGLHMVMPDSILGLTGTDP